MDKHFFEGRKRLLQTFRKISRPGTDNFFLVLKIVEDLIEIVFPHRRKNLYGHGVFQRLRGMGYV